jgi:hypothetical protein
MITTNKFLPVKYIIHAENLNLRKYASNTMLKSIISTEYIMSFVICDKDRRNKIQYNKTPPKK